MKEFIEFYVNLCKMTFWCLVGSVMMAVFGLFSIAGLVIGTIAMVLVSPWVVVYLWKHRNDVKVPDVLTPPEQADLARDRLVASQRGQEWTGKVN